MTDKVVDASAVAAIIYREPTSLDVRASLRGMSLLAPDLIGYELANACVKKIRAAPIERSDLLIAFQSYKSLAIQEVSVDKEGAAALACDKGISLYDASYLWLAKNLGVELVTLDQRLAKAAQA